MKKLFITLLFVLSSTFSIADDDHEHKPAQAQLLGLYQQSLVSVEEL